MNSSNFCGFLKIYFYAIRKDHTESSWLQIVPGWEDLRQDEEWEGVEGAPARLRSAHEYGSRRRKFFISFKGTVHKPWQSASVPFKIYFNYLEKLKF